MKKSDYKIRIVTMTEEESEEYVRTHRVFNYDEWLMEQRRLKLDKIFKV